MADEQSRAPFNKRSPIPQEFDWQSLLKRDGDELETHYRHVLELLGKEKGMLAVPWGNLENSPEESKIGFRAR
jgi:type I restriction enzyme M protein